MELVEPKRLQGEPRDEHERRVGEWQIELVWRIQELESALRAMTTNRVHDALCQAFEAWENEHSDFDRARLVLGDIKVQVRPEDVAAGPIETK